VGFGGTGIPAGAFLIFGGTGIPAGAFLIFVAPAFLPVHS
jgi:hypothetical protein